MSGFDHWLNVVGAVWGLIGTLSAAWAHQRIDALKREVERKP